MAPPNNSELSGWSQFCKVDRVFWTLYRKDSVVGAGDVVDSDVPFNGIATGAM